jgi:hypothetical protein
VIRVYATPRRALRRRGIGLDLGFHLATHQRYPVLRPRYRRRASLVPTAASARPRVAPSSSPPSQPFFLDELQETATARLHWHTPCSSQRVARRWAT